MQPADPTESAGGPGAALAAARRARGLSVAEVSERTRIRTALIKQMENDDFTACGGSVYARGHIRSIARALGLDPAPLVTQFDEVHGPLTGAHPLPTRQFDRLTPPGDGARRGFPRTPALIVALVAVCLLVLLGVLFSGGSTQPSAGGRPVPDSGVAPASPSPDANASNATAVPTAPAEPTPTQAAGVNVQVAVRGGPSWLEVRDETERVLLQQILQPGDSRTVTAARSMEIKMGNAGAVEVSCNGRSLGPGGGNGQVVTVRVGIGESGDCAVGDAASR